MYVECYSSGHDAEYHHHSELTVSYPQGDSLDENHFQDKTVKSAQACMMP